MTYERINFVDQSVERPRTYEMTYNADGSVTLVDSFGLVDDLGTPINADTMNHIEDGISATAIRKYNENETFALNEWVLATVANETNFYKSLKDNNLGNPLTDTNYWEVVKIGSGGGLPVGTIIPVTASSSHVPENTLYCDGTEFSGAEGQMFRNLWTDYILTGKLDTCTYAEYENDLAIYGQCIKWAVDTANEKFRIPLIKDGSVIQQAGTNSIGKSFNAGLPNIEGYIANNIGRSSITGTGAFSVEVIQADVQVGTTSGKIQNNITLDASKSNSIYGNSDTVQMNAVAVRHFVVVATGSINQNEADWSEFASSLASKANKTDVDGQWNIVPDYPLVFTSLAIGDYTMDISDYLPADNYVYEVMLICATYTTGDSQKNLYVGTDLMPITSELSGPVKVLVDNSVVRYERVYPILFTQNRTLTAKITGGKMTECNIRLIAYRRIGTNQ